MFILELESKELQWKPEQKVEDGLWDIWSMKYLIKNIWMEEIFAQTV